jgi:hypothetical protein
MNQSAPRMTDCLRLLVYFFVTNNYPKSVYNPHQSTLSTCGALNSSGRCAFVTFMRSKFTGLFFLFSISEFVVAVVVPAPVANRASWCRFHAQSS